MAKTAMVRARIIPELKTEVENIFNNLGLNPTEAITLFYSQVKLHKGLPFDVKIPNKTTLNTFNKTDQRKDIIECKNAKDMFKKLGI